MAGQLPHGPIGEGWAHLCIDMQVMFTDVTAWETPWIPQVLPKVLELVSVAPARTVYTRFIPPRTPDDAAGVWRDYWTRWEDMTLSRMPAVYTELLPALAPYAAEGTLIDKQGYSPWHGSLNEQLRQRGIDTLVVSGTETEMCVLAAVLGAVERGYRIIVAADAVCSSADETHDAMMKIYHDRFSLQVETADVADILRSLPG